MASYIFPSECNVMWIHEFNQLNLTEKHYEMFSKFGNLELF
jgi:hypothetical protein